MEAQDPGLLSIPQACARLRIKRSFAYLLMGSGELRAIRIGRRRFVTAAEIQRFIAVKEESAAKEAQRRQRARQSPEVAVRRPIA
jgi:excisionase family DNA binding protein